MPRLQGTYVNDNIGAKLVSHRPMMQTARLLLLRSAIMAITILQPATTLQEQRWPNHGSGSNRFE